MLLEGFDGIYPATVSPRDETGAFHVPTFERLIDRLYGAGVHGLYVCGATGEGYMMPVEERKLAAEAAVRSSKGCGKVLVHVGAASEVNALELARHAADIGADGVASMPPYIQGYKFQEILGYYTRLAQAAGIPAFVYYIPVLTHREMPLAEVEQLLEIEGVVGLKLSDYDLYLMERLANGPYKAFIYNGFDQVFAAGLLMGARGGIGSYYNVMPGHFVGIHEAVGRGDLDTARRLQSEVNRVIQTGLGYGGQSGVREILRLQGIDCGPLAPPAELVTAEESARLRAELEASGVSILE
jgi:N-acetylneuraminate lyase